MDHLTYRERQEWDIKISWVRDHSRVKGNEQADRAAGQANPRRVSTVTLAVIRAKFKRRRAKRRQMIEYVLRLTDTMEGPTLAAYMWYRAGKGPLNGWLHRIGSLQTPVADGAVPQKNPGNT